MPRAGLCMTPRYTTSAWPSSPRTQLGPTLCCIISSVLYRLERPVGCLCFGNARTLLSAYVPNTHGRGQARKQNAVCSRLPIIFPFYLRSGISGATSGHVPDQPTRLWRACMPGATQKPKFTCRYFKILWKPQGTSYAWNAKTACTRSHRLGTSARGTYWSVVVSNRRNGTQNPCQRAPTPRSSGEEQQFKLGKRR